MRAMTITRDQSRDTGMALVLVLLLASWKFERDELVAAAAILHLVNMIAPQVFWPAGVVWFGLSHLIGAVMTRVLLTLVYGLVVLPIGLIRTGLNKDSLRLRAFKAGEESVMVERNHLFTSADLDRPF
jgi:hypothetical protein